MIPIDLELFKLLTPVVLVLWGLIFFLWSKVEHPLSELKVHSQCAETFGKLREVVDREGLYKLEENDKENRIKIKGILKIVDVILYRCWSKEIIFQVLEDNSSSRLVVTCKPSAFRITASSETPNYFTRESLDKILREVAANPSAV